MLSVAPGDTVVSFNFTIGGQQESVQVELFNSAAPQTVANFLNYVKSGEYANTFIHRIVDQAASGTSSAFGIVQGGGYSASTFSIYPPVSGATHITTNGTVPNEFSAAHPDVIGTLAMAKLGSDPNSATSEWFFNTADNSKTLGASNDGGFTVFGQVLGSGMTVINQIVGSPTLDSVAQADQSGYVNNVFKLLPPADQQTVQFFEPTPLINYTLSASAPPITPSNLVVLNSVTIPAITGTVFGDVNSNGTQDAGDQGLAGWTVYVDANNNGVLDPGESIGVTGASGQYSINVAPALTRCASNPK